MLQDNNNGNPQYPLKIIAEETKNEEIEYNEDLIKSAIRRIDFVGLSSACNDLGINLSIPEDLNELGEAELKAFHHVLFEVQVVKGELVSPTEKKFPIIMGIPDMCPQVGASQPE